MVIELRPGVAPDPVARWARDSALVAQDGVLTVRRGRQVTEHRVSGGHLRPGRALDGRHPNRPVELYDADRRPVLTTDLAAWVPGVHTAFAEHPLRPAGWLDAVTTSLADELQVTVDRKFPQADAEALPRLDVVDGRRRGTWLALQLLCAAVVAVSLVLAVVWSSETLVPAGLAALALVLLAGIPGRWLLPAPRGAWSVAAASGPGRVTLADPRWLHVVDDTGASGWLPLGQPPYGVDEAQLAPASIRLLASGTTVLQLDSSPWGTAALASLASRLRAVDGLRTRSRDGHPELDVTGPEYGDLAGPALPLVLAVPAVLAWPHSPVGAALLGSAAATGLVLWAVRRRLGDD